jgi:hypothetical protein
MPAIFIIPRVFDIWAFPILVKFQGEGFFATHPDFHAN